MEKMSEVVSGSQYQRLHHMLSESAWDRSGVRRQLIADANAHFGHACALLVDESAFAKKGDKSAGVARQWNGRLGKTDNSQVGVFAAVVRDRVAAAVDSELYVPETWFDDAERCEDAGIPKTWAFRTKGEIALEMIRRLRREGLNFSYVAFDAGYGHLPWLLRALNDEEEIFLADVHSDQMIYLSDPAPVIPARRSAFEDAKGACGMADYQVRGFHAWHHHMALVMIALMFLAKERLANRETTQLLSCNDLVEIMRHKLPTKINCDEDLVSMIENRHRRRQVAMDRAYRKQAIMIAPSAIWGI